MRDAWIYIMTNRPHGTLYVGVTTNLARRAWEHGEGVIEGFTRRHGLHRLVYVERHSDVRNAIQREQLIGHWARAWKVRLIQRDNPEWDDLYDRLAAGCSLPSVLDGRAKPCHDGIALTPRRLRA